MNIATAALLLVLPAVAAAQATVEAAMGTAHAATTVGAGAPSVSKAIGGAFEKLNGTLDKAVKGSTDGKDTQAGAPTAHKAAAAGAKPRAVEKAPAIQYESPSEIREGIDLVELTRRFGPPALKISAAGDQELYCYVAKDGTSVDVSVRSDKVVAVQTKAPATEAVGLTIH